MPRLDYSAKRPHLGDWSRQKQRQLERRFHQSQHQRRLQHTQRFETKLAQIRCKKVAWTDDKVLDCLNRKKTGIESLEKVPAENASKVSVSIVDPSRYLRTPIAINVTDDKVMGINIAGNEMFHIPLASLSFPITAEALRQKILDEQTGTLARIANVSAVFHGGQQLTTTDYLPSLDKITIQATIMTPHNIGQTVRCRQRDDARSCWCRGKVVQVSPLRVLVDAWDEHASWAAEEYPDPCIDINIYAEITKGNIDQHGIHMLMSQLLCSEAQAAVALCWHDNDIAQAQRWLSSLDLWFFYAMEEAA